jgi:hypothetical protein
MTWPAAPLHVRRRPDTGSLEISGLVELSDGSRRRIRKRPQRDNLALAREEVAALEAPARRERLEHMGRSAGQTEMDALGDLREEIRTLGAGSRESQRGFRASGDADFTSARCVNPDQPIKTAIAQRHRL